MKRLILYILFFSFGLIELKAQVPEIDSLENLLKEHTKEDSIRVNIYNEIAFILRKHDLSRTIKYADAAGELSVKINYPKGKAESLRILGLYYYYKSEYTKALTHYEESSKISNEYGNKSGIAKCFNNIGNVHRKQGNYTKALENFQRSLQISEEISDKNIMSSSIGNIGLIYWKQKNYTKALEYYKKSLKIFEELGHKKGVSNALNNIGILYFYQDNYSKSLNYIQKSLEIDEELGDTPGMSYSLNNIGEIYLHMGNYSKALEYNLKSLKIRKETGDKYGTSTSYKGLGAVYIKTKNYTKALEYTKKSLKIAIEHEMINEQKDIYKQLSDIYSKTQNYKEAYKNHVLYKELNDSVFNEENIKKITGLEYQYKFEKEKQATELIQQKKDAVQAEEAKQQKTIRNSFIIGFILMLMLVLVVFRSFFQKRKANTALAEQKYKVEEKNKELNQLNSTQNRLLSIISHDFKAPLSAFYSITSSIKNKFDKIERKEIDNYLNRMLNSSVALKLQLENMLNWAINQSREIKVNKSLYNLNILAYKIIIILQEFANEKSVAIENQIDEDIELLIDGKLLGIVLNNLIANAVKFSSTDSKVVVFGKKDTEKIILSVKDFGIGMAKTDAENLFTDKANYMQNENSGTGLGLIVSKDIVQKLGGKIWAKSEPNKGTEIFIEFC